MTPPDFKARARELREKAYERHQDVLKYEEGVNDATEEDIHDELVSTALEEAFEEGKAGQLAQVQARFEDFESWMAENHIDGSGEYEAIWDWFQERQLTHTTEEAK